MRFTLTTRVGQAPAEAFPVFGEVDFVESLAPSFTGLRVVKIGLALGDEIEVRFTRLGPRGPWISRIIRLDRDDRGIVFVDRSTVIPWPFAWLEHHHGILADGTGSRLVDDVRFRCRPRLLGPFVWPVLRLSFALRGRVYRRRFGPPAG